MKKISLTFLYICSLCFTAFAQNDSSKLKSVIVKLNQQTATHPVEKVYLHLNKPGYQQGDTIWFKGYLTAGVHHQLSALSGTLYVELINEKDKVISSLKLKAQNGITTGNVAINNNLPVGSYRLRAYTNWMRNAGPEYFFVTNIPIGDAKNDAVFVTSNFNTSGINREAATQARLTFTDKNGGFYNNREVAYEIKTDASTIFKGNGITDEYGKLTFAFSDKGAAKAKGLDIYTHIKLLKGVTADKRIILNRQGEQADIQFFPEGGQLVNGVRSKVAIKAVSINGLGIDAGGTIMDNDHNEVAEFKTVHAGMGVFAFTPEAGKKYSAKITLPDSSTIIAPLPVAEEKGFVLAVNNSDPAKITVRLATNTRTMQEQQNQQFYLVGQANGAVYYTTLGKLDGLGFNAIISKAKFPGGIVQFTLFSADMQPLNERIVFIQDTTRLTISMVTNKAVYATNEKVNLSLMAKDSAAKYVPGSFSLSVYNDDNTTVNENSASTILSNILLTSDLKGYIEAPNYYFNNPSAKTAADLDILMLTQGYRRFYWKDVMAGNLSPVTFLPGKGLSISGTITTFGGKPVANGKVQLVSLVDKLAIDTVADAAGKFSFAGIEFPDSTKLLLQGRKANDDKNVNVVMDKKPAIPVIAEVGNGEISEMLLPAALPGALVIKADTARLSAALKTGLAKKEAFNFANNNKLKDVTIKGRKNLGTEIAPWMTEVKRSDNLNGPGHADQVFTAEDVNGCSNIADCLVGKIHGVMAVFNLDGTVRAFYLARHSAQSITHKPAMIVILDGVQGTVQLLESISSNQVLTIEALESASYLSIYGSNASGGALIVTTRRGNEGQEDLGSKAAPNVTYTTFSGYNVGKQFYVPKYNVTAPIAADARDAVYWNPNIITDNTGKRIFSYYNSGVKGTYRAVIEGIDDDGNVGRFVYRYKVE